MSLVAFRHSETFGYMVTTSATRSAHFTNDLNSPWSPGHPCGPGGPSAPALPGMPGNP